MDYFERPDDKDLEFRPGTCWNLFSGYEVNFQSDGNLIIYNPYKKAVWASNTAGMGATLLKMQADGNLVIYNNIQPLWDSKTNGQPGAYLAIQEDGNLVIYTPEMKPIWATGTNGK